jgi:hypothetical protein
MHVSRSIALQFRAEETNYRLIEIAVECGSIEASGIPADSWCCCGKGVTAWSQEHKVVNAGNDMFLRKMRKLLAENCTVPRIGSLRVVLSAPELDGNTDHAEITGSKQETHRRCRDDGNSDPRIVDPGWFVGDGV